MTPILERVDFATVISNDAMMGKLWKKLSIPQQTILLAAYGQPLPSAEHLAAWSVINGKMLHDKLGYPTKIFAHPYTPALYDTVVGLLGRRSGKSYVTCFAVLYEIIFGGHLKNVNEGEEMVFPYIAQDLPTARKNMKMIGLLAQQVKTLKPALTKFSSDLLEFYDGRIKVQIEPPKVKTGRGWAMPVIIADEVGFWYKASDNADPDYEVLAAVTPSQLQFAPFHKTFIISSPYTEEGILYEYFRGGTNGEKLALKPDDDEYGKFDRVLVVNAPTAAMQNPRFDPVAERKYLERKLAEDSDVFTREFLAKFVRSVSGFIESELVVSATDVGIKERKPADVANKWRHHFVSVMDPAFRHDSFAFSIFHRTEDGTVVQDVLRVWTPDKKLGIVLDPDIILSEIAALNREWGISMSYSDQYQLESLQQLAMRKGFNITGNDFTMKSKQKLYGSLKNLLRIKKIRLLDKPIIFNQLTRLQQKNTPMGGVQISAPPGAHDDVASVLALGAEVAIQLYPSKLVDNVEPSHWDIGLADMKRKRAVSLEGSWGSFDAFGKQ